MKERVFSLESIIDADEWMLDAVNELTHDGDEQDDSVSFKITVERMVCDENS